MSCLSKESAGNENCFTFEESTYKYREITILGNKFFQRTLREALH